MTVYYSFDNTLNGLLTAVFETFALHEQPEMLLAEGDQMPLFCERLYQVPTDEEKAGRVWKGLENRLPKNAVRMLAVSWLSAGCQSFRSSIIRYSTTFAKFFGSLKGHRASNAISLTLTY